MYKNLSIRSIIERYINWVVWTQPWLVIGHIKFDATSLLGQDNDHGIHSAQLALDLVELEQNFIMSLVAFSGRESKTASPYQCPHQGLNNVVGEWHPPLGIFPPEYVGGFDVVSGGRCRSPIRRLQMWVNIMGITSRHVHTTSNRNYEENLSNTTKIKLY